MEYSYHKSFIADAKNAPSAVKKRVANFISAVKQAESLQNLTGIKKMNGYNTHYRKRIGSYRIGFEKVGEEIVLIRVLKRGDIYKKFP